jgi:hypothetical protein
VGGSAGGKIFSACSRQSELGLITMTLSDFATLTTAVSGIAVTASIVYLALQTHQNAKHTRALINQGRVALIAQLSLSATDADAAAAALMATTGSAQHRKP